MALLLLIVKRILLIGLATAGILWVFGNERTSTWTVPPATVREHNEVSETGNLTEAVAEKISESLLEKNKNGPRRAGNELAIVMNPADILERLTTVTKELRQPLPTVQDSELVIVFTDREDAARAYAAALDTILGQLGSDAPPILDAFQAVLFKADTGALTALAERHSGTIRALKKLPVPIDLVPLHKQEILLLERTMLMLDALARYPTDPLRAYAAFQAYPKLIEEAKDLQDRFRAYFEKENSTF